ncbi:MAG: four helix bundle protein, partial [bacterium]
MKTNHMNAQELINRTTSFAKSCFLLAGSLPDTRSGEHLRIQLIRSATSVAANYRSSRLAQSRAGFISKLSIVIEEADETECWIDFALSLDLLSEELAIPLKHEA